MHHLFFRKGEKIEEKCKQYNLDVTKESLLEKAPDVDEQRKYKDDLER